MSCDECGEKPKHICNDFTKAVIEIDNPEQITLLRKVVIPASLGDDISVPPAIGKYRNVVLQYEANKHIYLYSSDGIPTLLETEVPQEVLDRIATLEDTTSTLRDDLTAETEDRQREDGILQQEIDDLKNNPDVVDIVATHADLMAYDTSTLTDRDIIRVLEDETHSGQSTYYRWDASSESWTYVGEAGDYYTREQVDTLLDTKQDELTAGENISIEDESGALVISAQDTTYTAGNGLNLNGTEFSVDTATIATQQDLAEGLAEKQDELTPGDNISIEDESGALTISAVDTTYTAGTGLNLNGTEFSADTTTLATQTDLSNGLASKQDTLTAGDNITIEDESGALVISAVTQQQADWNQGDSSAVDYIKNKPTVPSVVQSVGASTTDVMSQDAVTDLIYTDDTYYKQIAIGTGAQTGDASNGNAYSVAIGTSANAGTQTGYSDNAAEATAIGSGAVARGKYGTAIGRSAEAVQNGVATANGCVSIGSYASSSGTTIAIGGGTGRNSQSTPDIAKASYARGDGAIAIGVGAVVKTNSGKKGSIALGAGATVDNQTGVMNIGTYDTSYGYSNSGYRLLTGVYDPQAAHDAATKGYADSLIPAATYTTNEWNALWA